MFGVGLNENSLIDPTVNDDLNKGFTVGSFWFNRSINKCYICLNNTQNNAVWKLLTLTDENGNTVIEKGLQLNGVLSVSLTANTNNLIINNLQYSTIIRMQSSGNINLTGIVPPDITKSYYINIFNVGSSNITFINNSNLSLNQNKFFLGSNIIVQSNEGLILIYDTVDLKWRSPAKNI
jgi:hypothetical protein